MANEFWNRAQENLTAAKSLLEQSLFNAATNRAYYAVYHAAAAIIKAKGLEFNTDHARVQATFNGEVIRRSKKLGGELKGYLTSMHKTRAIADYEEKGVSKQAAKEQLKKAEYFISKIAEEIQ
jgi:uncharacterized protein (UPF0332 family)